jgi:hypothetical protein
MANGGYRRGGVIAVQFGEGPSTEAKAVFRCRQGSGATSQRLLQLGTCSPGQPPEGELDGTEGHEAGQGFRKVLKVLGETPVTPEPGEGAFDDPPAR